MPFNSRDIRKWLLDLILARTLEDVKVVASSRIHLHDDLTLLWLRLWGVCLELGGQLGQVDVLVDGVSFHFVQRNPSDGRSSD